MPARRHTLCPIFVVALAAAPRSAPAQPRPQACPRPARAADDHARSLYRDGERLYASGRYRESVTAFAAALARSGRPELYFDMANAHERMGEIAEAARLLERYVACADPPDADLIGERVRRLRAQIAAPDRPACPTSPPASAALVPRPTSAAAVRFDPGAAVAAIDRDAAASPPHRGSGAWPWLLAGGGALATAAGLAAVAVAADRPDCAEPGQGRACASAPLDGGSALARAAIVSGAIGAFALTTGAILLARDRGRRPARRRPLPWLGPGLVGLAYATEL
jgi:tetratricopeptide (TPR) repeat protein